MYNFEAVIGNDVLVRSLRLAIEHNRLSHAYIFDAPRGTGKRLIAGTFAKTLNCEAGGTTPCGECISCKTFESGNNPDVFYVRRAEGEREIKVDAVRNIINKNVEIKPYANKYKIFIIEDADCMNVAAQNAFLKTLEEPPAYAIFLLLTENYNKLLVTVLSRCQRYSVRPLPTDIIAARLTSKLGTEQSLAKVAALYSGGSMGKAEELASSDEFNTLRNEVISRTISLLKTDLVGMYALAAEMESYKANIDAYLDIMYLLYRDCLVYTQTKNTALLIQQDKLSEIKRICSLTGTKQLIIGCELINNAIENIRKRGDFQLVTENLFFGLKEK